MIRNECFRKMFIYHCRSVAQCNRLNSTASSELNIKALESEQAQSEDVFDDELRHKEAQIERKRNKSRLNEAHRNMLMETNPYPEPKLWHHGTLKYMRRVYGRYGAASGVDPALCWPVKEELEDAMEYERVSYPFTIPHMVEEAKKIKQEKYERVMKRQNEIAEKMLKLEEWKQQLQNKIAKKENEALDAKLRRERLIEEVKKHFGYSVDPKDDKFKEMLEKKEKEQKKEMKAARKKAREEKLLEMLLEKKKSPKTGTAQEPSDKVE